MHPLFLRNLADIRSSFAVVVATRFAVPLIHCDRSWMKRILIVEDDPALSQILRDNLTFEGFEVDSVSDGTLALARCATFRPDLVVLDVMLPGVSGFDVCDRLRSSDRTRVLMLTARGQKADKLRGLELGADDYMTKPFDLDEFLARVKAVLRRTQPGGERLLLGSITVDFASRTARRGSTDVYLTQREFELLQYLASRHGQVVYRDELLRRVWRCPDPPLTRCVDSAIARLRKKIEPDVEHPRYIHTVHGDGYTLTPDGRGASGAVGATSV
jgi:DNA-binding response OmpR family regulator